MIRGWFLLFCIKKSGVNQAHGGSVFVLDMTVVSYDAFPRRGLPQGPSPEFKLTHYIYKIEKTVHSTAWSLQSVQSELVLDCF